MEEIIAKDCLPDNIRLCRKKVLPGKGAADEIGNLSSIQRFEITVFNLVYDTTLHSLEKRFVGHTKLYEDLSLLCPTRFVEISEELPNNALTGLDEPDLFKQKLVVFASSWPSLKKNATFPYMNLKLRNLKAKNLLMTKMMKILLQQTWMTISKKRMQQLSTILGNDNFTINLHCRSHLKNVDSSRI